MIRLPNLTLRNALIATHDALATGFALLASFYLHFEGDLLADRLPLVLRILPYFIVFSVVVCYVFNLTTTKWRFISLPDALNILRVATVLAVALLVLDYILSSPHGMPVARIQGTFFFGKVTIVLFWFLEVFCLSALRFAYRYFRYTRVRHHARRRTRRRRCWSAAPRTPKFCCAELKAAPSSESGRSACCRRRAPTAASRSGTSRCSAASTISRT